MVPTLAIGRRGAISVQVPLSPVPADGRTVVPVTIRVLDAQGAPLNEPTLVTLELHDGKVVITGLK